MSDESIVDLVKKHQAQTGITSPENADQAAVIQKAQAMSESIPVDTRTEEVLANLLKNVTSKLQWITIELPSQGLLYPSGQNQVDIRPLTYDDERILKSVAAVKDPDSVIEKLLRNCIRGVDASELTPQDRLYILFRIRGLSYGDKYPIDHDCEKCGSTSKLEISIQSLEVNRLTPEHMEFTLPDSEQDVVIKLPRLQDSHLFNTVEAMHENLPQFVYSIGGVTDKTIVEAFIQKTTVRDVDILRNRVYDSEYGMENHFFYNCQGCGMKNKVPIELNASFFTAS